MLKKPTNRPSRGHMTRHVLMAEAERRVRAGEMRVSVARDLQIPASTMAIWAARGRWRQTDLQCEAAGLPPLPLPYYARDDRNITAGSRQRAPIEAAAQGDALQDLSAWVRTLGEAARVAFEAGDLARAETKLKEARRLKRIEEGLTRFAPMPAVSALDMMTEEEMREEVRRLVGLA